jgi:hypothetical protein
MQAHRAAHAGVERCPALPCGIDSRPTQSRVAGVFTPRRFAGRSSWFHIEIFFSRFSCLKKISDRYYWYFSFKERFTLHLPSFFLF